MADSSETGEIGGKSATGEKVCRLKAEVFGTSDLEPSPITQVALLALVARHSASY